MNISPSGEIRVLQRALSLLRILRDAQGTLSVVQLAQLSNLSRATTTRLLRDLEQYDLVASDKLSGRYALGYGLLELASGLWGPGGQLELIRVLLQDLRRETSQTTALSVRVGMRHIVSIACESTQAVRAQYHVGQSAPLHVGAAGRAILAYASQELTDRLLSGTLEKTSPLVITDPTELRAELNRVRQRGFALSESERTVGLAGLAVPVIGVDRAAEAAVVVVCPAALFRVDELEQFAKPAQAIADRISQLITVSTLSLKDSVGAY